MAYVVPLRFINIAYKRSENKQFDVAICATRIVTVMSYDIFQARKTVQAEKRAGTLINAAGIAKTKSVIFLDNGAVIASPLSVRRIMTLIEKAEEKGKPGKITKKCKVYDVYDEEPDDEEEEPEDDSEDTDLYDEEDEEELY